MAITKQPIGHYRGGKVIINGSLRLKPTGSTADTGKGFTLSSTAAGTYKVTFSDKFAEIESVNCNLQVSGTTVTTATMGPRAVVGTVSATSGYVYFRTRGPVGTAVTLSTTSTTYRLYFSVAAKGTSA